MSTATIDNQAIYEARWRDWVDMKQHGPASRWLRFLVRRNLAGIDASAIRSVLDVGCGEGTLTAHLARVLPEAKVLGIDFAQSGIDLARRAHDAPRLQFTRRRLDEEADIHDLVSAFEVLEHIEDWEEFLGEMASHARRYLLLSFPTGRMRPFETGMGHYRNYAPGQVEEALQRHGFQPASVCYAGFPFYSPLYRDFCNLTNSGFNRFTTGKYGFLQKRASDLLLLLFLLSTRRRGGDQFCGLFAREEA